MRFLKLASAKNPYSDYILLNGGYFDENGKKSNTFRSFNGFLCISFQTLGVNRKLDFLAIKNRQIAVDNKIEFDKYNLIVEILSKYREYDTKYSELITFLDRNKKDGFRLYYRPYGEGDIRYCLCDIEKSAKTEKMQPITLTLTQNSLWLGEEQSRTTSYNVKEEESNLFAFKNDDGYYSASFSVDDDIIPDYYCMSFYSNNIDAKASIKIDCYNEVPLKIIIYGKCINPIVSLYKKNENKPIRSLQVLATIDKNYYVEINSNTFESGVWYVNKNTKEKVAYDERINNELGSPYFYIEHGEYYLIVKDEANNAFTCDVFWQEEYIE